VRCFSRAAGAGEFVVKTADLARQFMLRLAYILASEILDKDKTLTQGCSDVTRIATVRRVPRNCGVCSQGYLTG
jgi:hypothetical protein